MRLRLTKFDKVGLFLFAALIITSSLTWLFEERFTSEAWKTNPSHRYKMVDDLIEHQYLIGKTKDEVIQLLGKPNWIMSSNEDVYLYRIGKAPSFFNTEREELLVAFDKQIVEKVALTRE